MLSEEAVELRSWAQSAPRTRLEVSAEEYEWLQRELDKPPRECPQLEDLVRRTREGWG